MNDNTCKICEKKFDNDRSFHAHLKAHDIRMVEYYQTHYPRYDLYDKKIIKFKTKKQYFYDDFKFLFDTIFPLSELATMAWVFVILNSSIELDAFEELEQSKNILRDLIQTNNNIVGDPVNDYNPNSNA